MTISIISFTSQGQRLSLQLREKLLESSPEKAAPGNECVRVLLYTKYECDGEEKNELIHSVSDLGEWAAERFERHNAIVFVSACGIAVRTIAPLVQDKRKDSLVLVMDEAGHFVIPLLSGHIGGANRLAQEIAKRMGAVPVITTATDVNGKFAVDVFAQEQGLYVRNKSGIKEVSSRILRGEKATIALEGMTQSQCAEWLAARLGECPGELVPVDDTDFSETDIFLSSGENAGGDGQRVSRLYLNPREYILGMGCRKGKTFSELRQFAEERLRRLGIVSEEIYAIASIARKRDEEGLWDLADYLRVPFLTFSERELEQAQGEFEVHGSAFVLEQVGVDNVCERAAMAACGGHGTMVMEKDACDGMTLAIVRRDWRV
jgi:cobalt-precorrin 5A hydrolase